MPNTDKIHKILQTKVGYKGTPEELNQYLETPENREKIVKILNKKVGYSGTVQDFDNYIGAVKVPKVEGVQQTKAPVLSAGVPDLSVNVKPPVNVSPVAPLDNTRVQRPEVNLDVINRANDEFTVMDDKTINTELETLKKENESLKKENEELKNKIKELEKDESGNQPS